MTQTPVRTPGARVTITDVARAAAVSPTTVSHVLSGKRLVAQATRERVEHAVQELGYRPNQAARNLRTRRSHMVAVLLPDITNPFYSVMTRGLADVLQGGEYGTYVCNTDGRLDRERAFLQDVADRGADGLVIACTGPAPAPVVQAVVDADVPVVCLGGALDHPGVDQVIADDTDGACAATLHLLGRGSRRTAMIAGPGHRDSPRVTGYARALTEMGHSFEESLIVQGDWTRPSGRSGMHQLMRLEPRPDAVFCANDLMAIGAMDAARELGLSIPGDVALAGFDDIDAAALVSPSLTTVGNPSYETGRSAGELLLRRMRDGDDGPRRSVTLPCPLVRRESA